MGVIARFLLRIDLQRGESQLREETDRTFSLHNSFAVSSRLPAIAACETRRGMRILADYATTPCDDRVTIDTRIGLVW